MIDKTSGQTSIAMLTGTATFIDSFPITPTTHDFGSVTVGSTRTFSFTVKNSGIAATDVPDFCGGSNDFIIDGQTCKGVALPPASQCTFTVTFAPKIPAGVKTATTILTTAGVAMATAHVTGTAVVDAGIVVDAGLDEGTPEALPAYAACFDCGEFAATTVGQTSPADLLRRRERLKPHRS